MSANTPPGPPAGTSFKVLAPAAKPTRRLIISLEGEERQGKTHFALSAPGPLAYMQMDPGGDEILDKMKRLHPKKVFWHSSYWVDVKPGMSPTEIALKVADPIWSQTCRDFEAVLPKARTIVIDTASEWFTALRLARFGKLTQVMPEDYGPVYAEFRRLLRLPYNHSCNVIYLHKLKREFDRSADNKTATGKRAPAKATGNMVREGFNGFGYEVQIEARMFKDQDGEFNIEVRNCRQDPALDGTVLSGPLCDFESLAMSVYPDSSAADWK